MLFFKADTARYVKNENIHYSCVSSLICERPYNKMAENIFS